MFRHIQMPQRRKLKSLYRLKLGMHSILHALCIDHITHIIQTQSGIYQTNEMSTLCYTLNFTHIYMDFIQIHNLAHIYIVLYIQLMVNRNTYNTNP